MQIFFENTDQIERFLKNLSTEICPRCGACGPLMRHGFIYGYIEDTEEIRGWRIYCDPDSARGNGCGHAPSVRLANTLPGRSLSALQLMSFILALISGDSIYGAWKKCGSIATIGNGYRLYKRLKLCQSIIRTRLFGLSPPQMEGGKTAPLLTTLTGLKEALGIDNAVSVYQKTFQQNFLKLT